MLIFRSENKGGKSIEKVFTSLSSVLKSFYPGTIWVYNIQKSFLSNIISLRKHTVDVFHITGDITYMALFLWPRKTVITFHDIGRYKELHGWKRWLYGRVWIAWPIRMSSMITTVSEFSRKDILDHFKSVPSGKIKIIYNGVNPNYTFLPRTYNSTKPRILQVGTAPNKNLETLIQAVSKMSCTIIIVGNLTPSQYLLLKDHRIDFENYINLTEEKLKELYERSDLVVYNSLHEGFGLPVIEAQAIGRPLIVSRMTSLPEVSGKGAHYIDDPFDANELSQAIQRISHDEDYRKTLIAEGRINVSQFGLEKMINAYMDLYKGVSEK